MASGISVPIGADASEFASAVKSNMVAPLQEAVDALSALGEDASFADVDSALRQVQSNLKEVRADANDAAKGIRQTLIADGLSGGSSVTEQLNQTQAAAKKVGDEAEEDANKLGKLKEGLSMNASFAVPSLVEALGQGGLSGALAETGGAISGMGMMLQPEFMLPLLVAGSAVTLFTGQMEQNKAAAEATAKENTAAAQQIVQAWLSAYAAQGDAAKQLGLLADTSKTLGVSVDDLSSASDVLGQSWSENAKLLASGSIPQLEKYKASLADMIATNKDGVTSDKEANTAIGNLISATTQRISQLKTSKAEEEALASSVGQTVKQYEASIAAQKDAAKQTTDLKKTLNDATSANDSMQQSIESSMNLSGKALDQVLDRSKKDADAILETQQKALTANEKYLDDFNAAVKNGLDEAGQQYVVQNRADFQEVVDTYGANSPQAKQYIANANKLGADSSSSFASQFKTGVADAMVAAAETVANQKFLVKMGVDSSGLSADMINAAAAARRAAQTYINNSPIIVPVTSGKIGVKMQ